MSAIAGIIARSIAVLHRLGGIPHEEVSAFVAALNSSGAVLLTLRRKSIGENITGGGRGAEALMSESQRILQLILGGIK